MKRARAAARKGAAQRPMRGWQPPRYITPPPTLAGSAGLVGHGESAPAAWLGSEAVFPGTQKARMRRRGDRDSRCGEEERRRARALVRVRAADKPGRWQWVRAADKAGGCQGDGGRRTHPGTRWEAGAASARQGSYLNTRHTRGAAGQLHYLRDKNDCGRMQMARPSRCRLRPAAAGCGRGRRAPRPAPRAGPTSPLCPRPRVQFAGAPLARGSRKGTQVAAAGNC